MAIVSLRSVVTDSFVNRIRGLAGGNKSDNVTAALRGQSSSVSISDGLRFGASTFARAVQGLNGLVSYLNLSESSLNSLVDITDKMIELASKSAKASTSFDARQRIDSDFTALAKKFQDTVTKSKFGDRGLLQIDEIAGIFETLGLDKESSDSIAKIFSKFITPDEDPTLASEQVKGQRPYSVPSSAYTLPRSDNTYVLSKISDGPALTGAISTVNSVYGANDDILNQNPGLDSVFTESIDGNVNSLEAGSLSSGASVKTVNPTTGYSVISSSEDFLGFNGSGFNQLFLVDSTGSVVHQITNESSAVTFGSAALSANDLTVAYEKVDGASRTIETAVTASLGDDPATSTFATLDTLTSSDDYRSLDINDAGTAVAFIRDASGSGGDSAAYLVDTASGTPDAFLAADINTAEAIGFYESNKVALKYNNGVNYDVKLFTDGGGAYTTLRSGIAMDDFAVLEKGSASQGYISYLETTANAVALYGAGDGTTAVTTVDFDAGDTVSGLSLAFSSSGAPEIGVLGTLASRSGDSDQELYRISSNSRAATGTRLARSSTDYTEIFDGTLNLANRPNAYRMVNDLNALRDQLTGNIKALGYARDVVIKNMALVRGAGFAFLDLSNQVTSDADAEQVAQDLRQRIRENARGALSQAENLESIVVAALAFDANSLTSSSSDS